MYEIYSKQFGSRRAVDIGPARINDLFMARGHALANTRDLQDGEVFRREIIALKKTYDEREAQSTRSAVICWVSLLLGITLILWGVSDDVPLIVIVGGILNLVAFSRIGPMSWKGIMKSALRSGDFRTGYGFVLEALDDLKESDFTTTQDLPDVAPTSSSADELKKFADLRDQGIITEEDFQKKKNDLLG